MPTGLTMESIDLIQDLGVVLLLAAAAAWICQRLGLPAVIGYLAAGVLVSPNTHSLGVLGNIERIHAIAQVGLVFLLFRLGQGLPLQRLKRISRPFLLGTILMALFVLTGCRWLGEILGWPGEYSLVLAAILMISSTEVLRKSLGETKETNREHGQTALTMTALMPPPPARELPAPDTPPTGSPVPRCSFVPAARARNWSS